MSKIDGRQIQWNIKKSTKSMYWVLVWETGPANNMTRRSGPSKRRLPHAWHLPKPAINLSLDKSKQQIHVDNKKPKFLLYVKQKLSWKWIVHHYIDWPLVFFNEILISAIEFFERLLKPQGSIALWQKSINQTLVAISKILIVWAASCISNELWNVHIIKMARWYVAGKEWKIDNVEVKIIAFVI